MRAAMDDERPEHVPPSWWQDPEFRTFYKGSVAEATTNAEHAVAGVHRRRLVVWAVAFAFVIATGVNIPVSAWISHDNAHTNCVLIGELAGLGKARGKVERKQTKKAVSKVKVLDARTKRFEAETPDRLGLTGAQFRQLVDEQRKEAQEQDAEARAAKVEQAHRQKVLDHVVHHACR